MCSTYHQHTKNNNEKRKNKDLSQDLNINSNLQRKRPVKLVLMSSLQYTVGYSNTCDFILWALDPSASIEELTQLEPLKNSHRACTSHHRCLRDCFLIDFWTSRVTVCGFGKVKPLIKWRKNICFDNSEGKDTSEKETLLRCKLLNMTLSGLSSGDGCSAQNSVTPSRRRLPHFLQPDSQHAHHRK